MALLAIVAAAGPGGASRDRVIGVLWPEVEEERARHALSQTLYNLRRDLGTEVVIPESTLRLDPERMTSDVTDFRTAVAAKCWVEAAALYTGGFLEGFHLSDAPDFERWVESERASLATAGIRSLEIAAKAAADEGRLDVAAEYWHRLTQIDPLDPRIAASYIQALAAAGDRAAASAHGKAYAEHVRREYEEEPDPAIQRLLVQLRESSVAAPAVTLPREPQAPERAAAQPAVGAPPLAADAPPPNSAPPLEADSARYRSRRVGYPAMLAFGLAVATLIAGLVWRASNTGGDSPPVLAVGRVRDLVAPDSSVRGTVLSEMLATSLGRIADLPVVAHSRMLELTPPDADTSRSAFTDAARRAGATEVIEGELVSLPGPEYRLEIRRVELAHGLIRGGYRVVGRDRVALFDSVTTLIAADLQVDAPAGSLADVSTRSPVAGRLYEEGLRALYQYDAYAANRLFRSAVREDSTFASAAYYAWRVAHAVGDTDEVTLAERAVLLAGRAPTRDRLLMLVHVGAERSDLRARAAAETLATKYPNDPEALVRAADVAVDLSRAVTLLNRSIALDSAAGLRTAAFCRLCDALGALTTRYEWADSVDAVERTLRRWRSLRPTDATPWAVESDWLVGFGRREEAEAARRRYESLGGMRGNAQRWTLIENLRLDDLVAADRECDAGLRTAEGADFEWYRWYCAIALRAQGRLVEARALASDARIPRSGAVRRRAAPPDAYMLGAIDMESGRALAAARAFRAAARNEADSARRPPGMRARFMTWALTLAATASVYGGDTLGARTLVDSIEHTGRQSLFRRDPLLHHFVRGLLHAHAQQHDAALQELRAAMDSPTYGYTRINLELGRLLLAMKRPAEAIPTVQAALHGGLEGSGLYVTRTEMHELLAQLFDAAGHRDSAAAHYSVVERAWRRTDPLLTPRHQQAKRWLAAAGGSPP